MCDALGNVGGIVLGVLTAIGAWTCIRFVMLVQDWNDARKEGRVHESS